jgi:hypothetical protein
MMSMNPDSCVVTNALGHERPSKFGGIFFQDKSYWDKEDFCSNLTGLITDIEKTWWKDFLTGVDYKHYSGKELREDSKLFTFVKQVRQLEWSLDQMKELWDLPSTTLILIGNISPIQSRTRWHLDWARARNWAVLLQVSSCLLHHHSLCDEMPCK